ncbi:MULTISPECIES: hypothetical protein [Methylobacterium]|uniref:Uncharacterized protein n=1 Tax=Methylobacterium jeotgali TaxID=381630 RepID=A0ABQ4SRD8_9HYPH|nr:MULTISPECIES: hypothetical protein [Methylobacterium]PIU08324.1 MAG: hypothetical protein COT56_01875 [Methylobacterium sp. CG09_land_8_20_14_0_10_71_15]PIU11608.1 MAG: hypothetical protein COT28_19250 [Methylobacterium sp. CG08_land_8_20_14_0_20_71_15]GJE05065.1 hypothetical protein AOPFMNJM_0360 [Methylobacterium jeotgali]
MMPETAEPAAPASERPPTPADWDARIDRLTQLLPDWLRRAVDWLREPSRTPVRVLAAVFFILGGFLAVLPVFGLWMLPLGLALLAQDVPGMKVPLERCARRIERSWERLRWR